MSPIKDVSCGDSIYPSNGGVAPGCASQTSTVTPSSGGGTFSGTVSPEDPLDLTP